MKIIKKFNPHSIFIKGGYVGLPVGIAAKLLKYPFVIHESDTVPGLSNKILSKWAECILVSYPEKYYDGIFDGKKIKQSGSPVRKDLLAGESERGFETFKLKKDKPVILIIGGSQGSRAINMVVEGALEDLLYDYQLIHITGELDYDLIDYRASKLPKDLKKQYRYYDFLSADLKDAYKISSIVVSRAGNNVLTELSALGKPSILVPLPTSTNGHQSKNALVFSRAGASYIINESKLDGKSLKNQLDYLFENKKELDYMSEKVKDLYVEDASLIIAKKIIEIKRESKKKNAKGKKQAKKRKLQEKSKSEK